MSDAYSWLDAARADALAHAFEDGHIDYDDGPSAYDIAVEEEADARQRARERRAG